MFRRSVLAVALCAAAAAVCTADTYKVSDYGTLKDMLENTAEPGDVLEVQPGVMYADSRRIDVKRSGTPEKPIIVRGVIVDGRRPVLDGSRVSTQRAMLWFAEECHDVIVENLEIRHAIGTRHLYAGSDYEADKNYGLGAEAANFRGSNITFRNCYIHHNGATGLFAGHSADYILIEDCEIAWNGVLENVDHHPSHNFYFCARHQMVKNCYIHDPRDGENFKSRGGNTIFAFNWVDEDYAYSIEQSSGGELNTLWLGNVVAKRTTEGLWQGRVFAIGDGTGTVTGEVVVLNNTFITHFPRDYFLFGFPTGTANVTLVNNVFAGPAEVFAEHKGQGTLTGTNNWLRAGVRDVPEGLENTIYGESPGFVNRDALMLRPAATSPLVDAGAADAYEAALAVGLEYATSGTEAEPSPAWLEALEDVKSARPSFEPVRKGKGFQPRAVEGAIDIGAYESE